jgi:polyisoprenoid-binding protein YceI
MTAYFVRNRSRTAFALLGLALILGVGVLAPAMPWTAETSQVDPAHSSVAFKIQHLGISWVQGRFDDIAGSCMIDTQDPTKSTFEMTIKTASIDTNVPKRDEHLRSPDFFDAKQFPSISFKSTAVKKGNDGLEVTGDLSLHGVTKTITCTLAGGKQGELPKGTHRIGYYTEMKLNRSDYGMDKMIPDVGDEVRMFVSFEAVTK